MAERHPQDHQKSSFLVHINGEQHIVDPDSDDTISRLIIGASRAVRHDLGKLTHRIIFKSHGLRRNRKEQEMVRKSLNLQVRNAGRLLRALGGDGELIGIRDNEGNIVGVDLPED